MPVAVNPWNPHYAPQQDSDLDKVIKGLHIADSVFGIASNINKFREYQQQINANDTALAQQKLDADPNSDNSKSTAGAYQQAGLVPPGASPMSRKQLVDQFGPLADYNKEKFKSNLENGDGPSELDDAEQQSRINKNNAEALKAKKGDAGVDDIKRQLQEARLNQLNNHRIPGNEAMNFGQGDSSSKALGALNQMLDSADEAGLSGPLSGRLSELASKTGQWGGGKTAASINSLRDTTALEVASYLKGGSPTDSEIANIKEHALPQITDSNEVRKQKTENLQMLIDARRGSQQSALGNAGYDVSQFPAPAQHKGGMLVPPSKGASTGGSILSNEAQAAPQDAFSSTQDKASQLLLKRQGMKGKLPSGK